MNRIQSVDALRGLAALLVMSQHVLTVVSRHPGAGPVFQAVVFAINREYTSLGQIGVLIFFLISGYLVPFSIRGPNENIHFGLSRFFRLYPAYWLSLIVAIYVYKTVHAESHSLVVILLNATMLQKAAGAPDINPAYWTLFVELLFYALAFSFYKFGWLQRNRIIVAAIAGLSLAALLFALLRYSLIIGNLPVSYLTFLAMMLLGTAIRNSITQSGRILTGPVIAGGCIILVLAAPTYWLAYFHNPDLASWRALTSALPISMLAFALALNRPQFLPRFLASIGLFSYSLYLLHDAPLQFSQVFFGNLSWPMAAVAIPVFVFGTSMVMAYCSYRLIERPAVQLGRKIIGIATRAPIKTVEA